MARFGIQFLPYLILSQPHGNSPESTVVIPKQCHNLSDQPCRQLHSKQRQHIPNSVHIVFLSGVELALFIIRELLRQGS